MRTAASTLLLTAVAILQQPLLAQLGCGAQLKPLKPVTPVGCNDTKLLCLCDQMGFNCQWEWICTDGPRDKTTFTPAWQIPLQVGHPTTPLINPADVAVQVERTRVYRYGA